MRMTAAFLRRLAIQPIRQYFPILHWGSRYDRNALSNDMIAALIVTIMLIPQSLAYALLAGLPPEAGIYASIAPITPKTICAFTCPM